MLATELIFGIVAVVALLGALRPEVAVRHLLWRRERGALRVAARNFVPVARVGAPVRDAGAARWLEAHLERCQPRSAGVIGDKSAYSKRKLLLRLK